MGERQVANKEETISKIKEIEGDMLKMKTDQNLTKREVDRIKE